ESGGADQREKRKKDRRGGVGWRSDGGPRNTLARVRREASPFALGGGCSYNPRVIPCRSTAGSPDRPGANGVPSTPKCATPYPTRHGSSNKPKTRHPPCTSTAGSPDRPRCERRAQHAQMRHPISHPPRVLLQAAAPCRSTAPGANTPLVLNLF